MTKENPELMMRLRNIARHKQREKLRQTETKEEKILRGLAGGSSVLPEGFVWPVESKESEK